MSKNPSETKFHKVYKVCFNSTTLKTTTLLMESGDVVDQLKRATDSQNFGSGEVSLISDGQIEP